MRVQLVLSVSLFLLTRHTDYPKTSNKHTRFRSAASFGPVLFAYFSLHSFSRRLVSTSSFVCFIHKTRCRLVTDAAIVFNTKHSNAQSVTVKCHRFRFLRRDCCVLLFCRQQTVEHPIAVRTVNLISFESPQRNNSSSANVNTVPTTPSLNVVQRRFGFYHCKSEHTRTHNGPLCIREKLSRVCESRYHARLCVWELPSRLSLVCSSLPA